MNFISHYFLIVCFCISSISVAQDSNKLLAGPMFSYIDSYGTQIWFLLESGASKIDLDIKDYENNSLLEYTFEVINKDSLQEFPFVISLEDLVADMVTNDLALAKKDKLLKNKGYELSFPRD